LFSGGDSSRDEPRRACDDSGARRLYRSD